MTKILKKTNYKLPVLLILAGFCLFSQILSGQEKRELSTELQGKGLFKIVLSEDGVVESSQTLLEKAGGLREVLDTFDGYVPHSLLKADLDSDNIPEIIAVFKHPDGIDCIPVIYSAKNEIKRIFPADLQDANPLICRRVIIATTNSEQSLCAKYMISYFDYGPPDLYRMRFYRISGENLVEGEEKFTEDSHFNVLLNKASLAFNEGKYFEAFNFAEQAIASSTGDITEEAAIEAIFLEAESKKFSKDFKSALKYYEKIVLEFEQNQRTDNAQKEIELISDNLENPEALSLLIDVYNQINCNNWETALEMLEKHPSANSKSKLRDKFLFIKAESLTALNKIEEAVATYNQIKEEFPNSNIIENVNSNLQDLEETPEEADGL